MLGARIRELRERARLAAQDLAAEIGLDPSAVSNIERGKRSVKTDELAKIAAALNVSPLAILEEESLLARLPVAPRTDGHTPTLGSAYARLIALAELHTVLQESDVRATPSLSDRPAVDLARWKRSSEQLSDWVRVHLETGRGEDRFSVLADEIEKKFGVDVIVEEHVDDSLSGAAITDSEFPLIFVNARQPTPRALFTLAHELGHVLADDGQTITLDEDLVGRDDCERFANAFAASLLMPEPDVQRIVREQGLGPESIARMLYDFGVSFESLVYRLHNLGIINASLRDRLRGEGWRRIARDLESPNVRERLGPDVVRSLIARLGSRPERRAPGPLVERTLAGYRNGVVSIRPLAALLGVDADYLLSQFERDPDVASIADEVTTPGEESDDDRYAGSPV